MKKEIANLIFKANEKFFEKRLFERGYFRPPGRGGKIHKNALNFFFSCRTAMTQRASERSAIQHS